MSQMLKVRIPVERVGVLIGREGTVKKKIESMCKVKLEINSETGEVDIISTGEMEDPTMIFKAQNMVLAIGRGFSPEKAFRLIDDDVFLHIINLRDAIGRSKRDLKRIKGRIIGKEGKTRRIIEETTNVDVSVYGHTVALIGRLEELTIAKEAIEKLVSGSQHKTVYKFLGRKRSELKRARLELWEKPF